tara:strand:+ start:216 stop:1076 length:861 start_codon:yes stop_codon:yes gene_type:complete
MKNISSLVNDIYNLFTDEQGVKVEKEEAVKLTKLYGQFIAQHIYNAVYEEKKKEKHIRLSQIGKPLRQIWYGAKGYEGEDFDGPTYIKFLYGNILEELLICLSKLSGHEVSEEQKKLEVEDVPGHQDARVDGTLVDFKSASNFSFKKFTTSELQKNDPFGYIYQLSAYAKDKEDKEAAWVVINKQTGELATVYLHKMEMPDVSTKIKKIKTVVKEDNPPPRCYPDIPDGSSGNRKLDFGCVYCSYKLPCWADANNGKGLRKFKYSNGPRYFTKIFKTPNTEEEELI